MDLAKVYEDAADVIRVNGWHRGDAWPGAMMVDWLPGAPVCTLGAFRVTLGMTSASGIGDQNAYWTVTATLTEHLRRTRGEPASIPRWNDYEVESADEVIDTLLDLAKTIRNGETS